MARALRYGILLAACGIVLLLLALLATWDLHRREIGTVSDEQKVARSLEIIRTSSPAHPKVLKVLFYGQSITLSGWHKAVVQHWQQEFPNTVFVVQNKALGGFSSEQLERTTARDIDEFYPDLIIFHDYGDHRAYERIIRLFRSQTAADIIVQNDYGNTLPGTPCAEGLHFTLHRPADCSGFLWYRQKDWEDEMSYHKIPALAKKYGLALEPQRGWWRDYMLSNHVDPRTITLPDGIHPNDEGKALMAAFFNRYFDDLVTKWNGQTEDHVVSIAPDSTRQTDGHEKVAFDGNRLELITSQPIASWPQVMIDGVSPSQMDGCYEVTRTSPTQGVPEWPAIRRITLMGDHSPEDWTATVTNISPDEQTFNFTVTGSRTGDEGSGDSAHDFTAKSGSLKIEPGDWMLAKAFALRHIHTQTPFAIHWSVESMCGGAPEVIDEGAGVTQYRYIVGTGLSNTRHTAELALPDTDLKNATEFRAYKPLL